MFKFYIENNNVLLSMNGADLKKVRENSVDASFEKHVPIYEIEDDKIIVSVGKDLHPMERDHYIEWIALESGNRISIVKLNPGDEPKAIFDYYSEFKIYAYCNLHGLWVKEVK